MYLLLLALACGTPEPAAAAARAFTNPAGELVCPVMGDVIEGPDKAVESLVHEGVTYYFCCDSCVHRFKEDPAQFANGRYLDAHDLWKKHEGPFPECEG